MNSTDNKHTKRNVKQLKEILVLKYIDDHFGVGDGDEEDDDNNE